MAFQIKTRCIYNLQKKFKAILSNLLNGKNEGYVEKENPFFQTKAIQKVTVTTTDPVQRSVLFNYVYKNNFICRRELIFSLPLTSCAFASSPINLKRNYKPKKKSNKYSAELHCAFITFTCTAKHFFA